MRLKTYEAFSKNDDDYKYSEGDMVKRRPNKHEPRTNDVYTVIDRRTKGIYLFSKPMGGNNNIIKNVYDLKIGDIIIRDIFEKDIRKASKKEIEEFKMYQITKKYNL